MKALQKIESDGTYYWSWGEVEEVEPAKPIPEIPPECWNDRPIDAQRCLDAMRAMCKGG
jgi:hypothetical protein